MAVLTLLTAATSCKPADDDDSVATIDDDDDDTAPDDDDTAPDDDDSAPPCEDDVDGDGFIAAECGGDDCDDTLAAVNPSAVEICANGLDDDCDGACVGCAGLCGEVSLSLADAKLLGEYQQGGRWVASAGDFNQDGFADVMVASLPGTLEEPASVYIVPGPQFGTVSLSSVAAIQIQGWGLDGVGTRNVASRDFNGDGERDFVTGGRCISPTGIVYGPQTGPVDAANHTILGMPPGSEGSRCSVASVGDVDADGTDDILIGSDTANSFLYSGPIASSSEGAGMAATFVGGGASPDAGYTVAGGGDINNDGFDDILIGDPKAEGTGNGAGVFHVFYGPLAGDYTVDDADATLLGVACRLWDELNQEWTTADTDFGYSMSSADLNADGFSDIIVGAPLAGTGGSGVCGADYGLVYVFYGPPEAAWPNEGLLTALNADVTIAISPGGGAGWSVSPAGDVNGDGWQDLLIGAPGFAEGRGGTHLLYGPFEDTITSAGATFVGEAEPFAQGFAGAAVVGAGDVNNDGYDDIVIGDPGEDEADELAGAAYILYGGPGF
ncbi:MAG: hypothetical protein GY898_11655 [Proteobacteria bacterium]|nr:hypothetical protein [Pseudomonadota bacterium]